MKYLKTICLFSLILLPSFIVGQDEIEEAEVTPTEMVSRTFDFPAQEALKAFHPFDYPHQRKHLGKDTDIQPGRLNTWIVGGLILLGLLVLIVFLIIRLKHTWLRIGIGIGGFLLLIPLGYLFLVLDIYAKMTPPTAMGRAMERLTNLSKTLGVEWLDLFHPKDDNYRLGMVSSRTGVIIVDYKSNQGWFLPKGQVAAIVAHPDETFKKDGQAVRLFTESSERSETPVQHLVFVLKEGNSPSQIWIRHHDDFYQYDAIALIESFILAWEQ